LQFEQANAPPKIARDYIFANTSKFAEIKARKLAIYKKHRAFVVNQKFCDF
jgi:hypothetical protein